MTYEESLAYLEGLVDWERSPKPSYDFDLGGFRSFLSRLGDPQKRLRNPILIAGTKGKGSTGAIIASALRASGYRVGLFTSPHLVSFPERIALNGESIAKEDFARFIEALRSHIKSKGGFRTVFEVLTAISFLYFLEKGVDFSVFEVGLGGRLDSTNVIDPVLSVITPISLDHTDVLGESLDKVAKEKAAIVRKGGMVVSAPQSEEVLGIIEETCRKKRASLSVAGRDMDYKTVGCDLGGSRFRVLGNQTEELYIPLLGRHQTLNGATAYLCLDLLRKGFSIPSKDIREGFSGVRWPGRLQIVGEKPWVVLDGAHNPKSAETIAQAVTELFSYRKLLLVFSCLSNKDLRGISRFLSPIADEVVVTGVKNPRSADPERLAKEFRREGKTVKVASSAESALEFARSSTMKKDLILVTGSFYLVGEVLQYLRFSPFSSGF